MKYTPNGVSDPEAVLGPQNSGTAATLPPVSNYQGSIWTLTGNCAFTMPTPAKGAFCYVIVIQDATGSRTTDFDDAAGNEVKWPGGTAPTTSTAAGAVDRYDFVS